MSDESTGVFEVKAARVVKPIPTGDYTGMITDVRYRTQPYHYADVVIKIEQLPDTEIEAGFACKDITPSTAFGKLISAFKEFKVGDKIVPRDALIGKRVALTVVNTPSEKDPKIKYPEVSKGSVVPIK
jgi:hypothetical protein